MRTLGVEEVFECAAVGEEVGVVAGHLAPGLRAVERASDVAHGVSRRREATGRVARSAVVGGLR